MFKRNVGKAALNYLKKVNKAVGSNKVNKRTYNQYLAAYAKGMSSLEVFCNEDNCHETTSVLESVNVEFHYGKTYTIVGRETFPMTLLIDITFNNKPCKKGEGKITDLNIKEQEKTSIDNVFYITSNNMLYEHMSVREYLTLLMKSLKVSKGKRNALIHQHLVTLNMSGEENKIIAHLDEDEKVLLLITAAIYAESKILILNMPWIKFSEKTKGTLNKLIGILNQRGVCFIIATEDYFLAESISNELILVCHNSVHQIKDIQELVSRHSKLKYEIYLEEEPKKLPHIFKIYNARQQGNKLSIYDNANITQIISLLESHDFEITRIQKIVPSLSEAIKTIMEGQK